MAAAADNSAGVPLVAVVNQDLFNLASAYDSFDPAVAKPVVVMPLLMDQNGNTNWNTSFMVMNVGDNPTYVKCTYVNSTYTKTSGVLNKY